jgi:hypothetical protein
VGGAVHVEQRAKNKEQRTKNKEQRTKNKEQRTKNKEQRTKNKEQRTKNKEQRTGCPLVMGARRTKNSLTPLFCCSVVPLFVFVLALVG